MTLDEGRLKDAERLIRFAMVVTPRTAGISKFFSHGAFIQYYGEPFRNPQLEQWPSVNQMISIILMGAFLRNSARAQLVV